MSKPQNAEQTELNYALRNAESLTRRFVVEQAGDASSMVTRNPAPDASPPAAPSPSKTFTVK